MKFHRALLFATAWAASVSQTLAQLPYNPTRLFLSRDGTKVYQFEGQGPQASYGYIDISGNVTDTISPTAIDNSLPFATTTNQAFLPIQNDASIDVLAGDCQDTSAPTEVWHFTFNGDGTGGTWDQETVSMPAADATSSWLAAGFSYSPTSENNATQLNAFGGMCPTETSNASTWTAQAVYSNSMLTVIPLADQSWQIASASSPPVAEAGLAIVPLSPTFSNTSGTQTAQQNFVLIGGHTQTAFINMSQVAVYSLPQAAWSFIQVNQPTNAEGELVKRSGTEIEPRSGHTALLSEDGTKIIVFGGWVGDVTTAATPQLAVLELSRSTDGSATWSWNVPSQTGESFASGQGLYGHGAVMLPGGVMMTTGGTAIGASINKRTTSQSNMFYNVSSSTWLSSYSNPNGPHLSGSHHTTPLNSSQKAGIGAGLGFGLAALIAIGLFWFFYRRRLKERRLVRERRLRELALGSEKYQSNPHIQSGMDGRGGYPEIRSASWGSRQEKRIESRGDAYTWAPFASQKQANQWGLGKEDDERNAERSGTEIYVPSPTRGLRKSLAGRTPIGLISTMDSNAVTGPGAVFRIDEEDEERSQRSVRAKTPQSRHSDPFKDPPVANLAEDTAEKRRQEVQRWVDDWQSAAESMSLSRNPSHARTYSNLSQAQSLATNTHAPGTGRSSPEKSDDRTRSNLSEKSTRSGFSADSTSKTATSGIARAMSQRSLSAGHALFAGAAAAMSRFYANPPNSGLDRSASRRSITLNAVQIGEHARPEEVTSLLRDHSPSKTDPNAYSTPPESPTRTSPTRDFRSHLQHDGTSGQRSRTDKFVMGPMRSMKRKLTGISMLDVNGKVDHYEEVERDANAEERQTAIVPEISDAVQPASGVPFWRGKRGARDWEEQPISDNIGAGPSSNHKRRSHMSARTLSTFDTQEEEYTGEEWDVESAVQKRVVQVMFTVPKEKLRVVNADQLSIISRSDIDPEDRDKTVEIKRMSSLLERAEHSHGHDEHDDQPDLYAVDAGNKTVFISNGSNGGKGKAPARY